jgi:perosamine synthetase
MFEPVIEFIRELYGSEELIPLHVPRFIGNEKKYLDECIDTNFVSSVGKFVTRFEEMVAAYTGARRAVVCVNGTQALYLSLKICGVKPEDEVITQPLTFIATVNAISYTGAKPVFVDVDLSTMGLSPDKLEHFIHENTVQKADGFTYNKMTGKKISACVPMHTFGHPVRIDEIVGICQKYNIVLVEDAAESLGSKYKAQHTGTFGKLGILSFNGNKTITTGGGGMILTMDEELGKLAKHLTTQAKVPHPWEFIHDQVGFNYRMPNINAALGVAQLEKLDLFIAKKRELASKYHTFFDHIGITSFREPEHAFSNYWLNTIFLKDRDERDRFLEYSNKNNIMTRPIWRLMNKLPMFTECQTGNLDNAGWLEDKAVNLPSTPIV